MQVLLSLQPVVSHLFMLVLLLLLIAHVIAYVLTYYILMMICYVYQYQL